ncbi:hypothetical protein G6F45_013852 [Rhizopus arrhizus]|nr:hypothetical protein G6F45_013852 [Rhizopus arrhizus]
MTVSASGSRSVTPSSRSTRSAINSAWLTTTTSASWAWRRAFTTKQSRMRGHSWPRQFSRVEVTRCQMSASSGTCARSLRSPVLVMPAKTWIWRSCWISLPRPLSSAAVTGAASAARTRGRSRANNWSCSVRVPVEISTLPPWMKAGTR